eukprot:TRINITY_DN27232_c0_g2_i1.p1 TRINITY_DN27232_c0_g2~~TRINITY_DN27232_c0_g2_i1.p1  ORF type:complete len:430 (+),score=79.64 TRINITY_DN27232_c0_g2_i1:96-1385(+)
MLAPGENVAIAPLAYWQALRNTSLLAEDVFDLTSPVAGKHADRARGIANHFRTGLEKDDSSPFASELGLTMVSKALDAYGNHGEQWVQHLEKASLKALWSILLMDEPWLRGMSHVYGIIWALLYRASSAIAPPSEPYAAFFSAGKAARPSAAAFVNHIASRYSLAVCDRLCYIEIATSYTCLAQLAVQDGKKQDLASYLASAQTAMQNVLFESLRELLEPAPYTGVLTSLFGMLHLVSQAPLLTNLVARFWKQVRTYDGELPEGSTFAVGADKQVEKPVWLAEWMDKTGGGALEPIHPSVRWHAALGTLLGAIRHGGVIPHDSDADLAIPVSDAGLIASKEFQLALLRNGYQMAYFPGGKIFNIYRVGETKGAFLWGDRLHYMTEPPVVQIYTLTEHDARHEKYYMFYSYSKGFAGFRMLHSEVSLRRS